MKNLFGIYKKGEEDSYLKFVLRRTVSDNTNKAKILSNEGNVLRKKKFPPQWLFLVCYIFIILGFIIVASFLKLKIFSMQ